MIDHIACASYIAPQHHSTIGPLDHWTASNADSNDNLLTISGCGVVRACAPGPTSLFSTLKHDHSGNQRLLFLTANNSKRHCDS